MSNKAVRVVGHSRVETRYVEIVGSRVLNATDPGRGDSSRQIRRSKSILAIQGFSQLRRASLIASRATIDADLAIDSAGSLIRRMANFGDADVCLN